MAGGSFRQLRHAGHILGPVGRKNKVLKELVWALVWESLPKGAQPAPRYGSSVGGLTLLLHQTFLPSDHVYFEDYSHALSDVAEGAQTWQKNHINICLKLF